MTDAPQFHVLHADSSTDRQTWLRQWEAWPEREVHAHPAYVELLAHGIGEPLCASWSTAEGGVLFPFILRDITIGQTTATSRDRDIVSPYGYGGAFVWGGNATRALAAGFWDQFSIWALARGVVSEFVRMSLFPDATLPFDGEVTVRQENIVCDLALEHDDLWMSFDRKVRKNVNKAERSGVKILVDETGERLSEFLAIYEGTLDRRNAMSGYYFDREFFEYVHKEMPGQYAYFHAVHDGLVVSTELVLVSAESVYSFLGGTKSEAFALRPNDLLKVEIMRWAKENGLRWFVLGGGYEPDDGIFRYKKSFSPSGSRPFSVGTRVLNRTRYDELVKIRSSELEAPVSEGFFPEYRG